ncbi:MAG TPA: FkbM family methyltransferase [Xanthobacteraceae bacterium]|nr:FkbM family methyltransferase [Xanthobacteraceae bacterium]
MGEILGCRRGMQTGTKDCRHGKLMYLLNDAYIGRSLDVYGEYSEGEVDLFRQLLRPGDVAVDVGANIGALTVPMARLVQPNGTIVAFEPQRAIFDILCNNLRLNALANVQAFRRAAGSTPSTIRVPALDYGRTDNFGGVALGGPSGEEVQLVTIDSLALPRLRLLKVDVEGMEHDVITGARATIERLRPAVYVENDRAEHSQRLIMLLFDIGYRLWWHITPLFNPKNFFGYPRDIFGDVVSFNMLGFPRADAPSLAYPEILSPDDFAGQPGARRR